MGRDGGGETALALLASSPLRVRVRVKVRVRLGTSARMAAATWTTWPASERAAACRPALVLLGVPAGHVCQRGGRDSWRARHGRRRRADGPPVPAPGQSRHYEMAPGADYDTSNRLIAN